MRFVLEKERLSAIWEDGTAAGHIVYAQLRRDLVNITHVYTDPRFRDQGLQDDMMEALLTHLHRQGKKAVLTCPQAQKYVADHPQWKSILPGELHCTTH